MPIAIIELRHNRAMSSDNLVKEAIRSQQAELDAKSAARRDAGTTWKTRTDKLRKPGADAEIAAKSI